MLKGLGNLLFRSVKRPSRANRCIYVIAVKKLRKCSGVVIYSCFNLFAPGNFAEKCILKLVERFSGHFHSIRAKTYLKPIYRLYTAQPSDPDAK